MPGYDDYDEMIEDSADTFGAPPPAAATSGPAPAQVELDWAALTDDSADVQLARLWTWVRDVVIERYELGGRVPPCWPLHGQAIEELTALWVRWAEVFQPKFDPETGELEISDRRGMDALLWYDHLETVTLRLANNFSQCLRDLNHATPVGLPHPDVWDGQQARPVRRDTTGPDADAPAPRRSLTALGGDGLFDQ